MEKINNFVFIQGASAESYNLNMVSTILVLLKLCLRLAMTLCLACIIGQLMRVFDKDLQVPIRTEIKF